MLDAFIIEELRRREQQEELKRSEQNRVELPVPEDRGSQQPPRRAPHDSWEMPREHEDDGVVVMRSAVVAPTAIVKI